MPTNTDWKIVEMLSRNAEHIDCKEHFEIAKEAMIEAAKVRKTRHNNKNFDLKVGVLIAELYEAIMIIPNELASRDYHKAPEKISPLSRNFQ